MKFGGHLFWTRPRGRDFTGKGRREAVLKIAKWALFEI
jgi:hypothetical protein